MPNNVNTEWILGGGDIPGLPPPPRRIPAPLPSHPVRISKFQNPLNVTPPVQAQVMVLSGLLTLGAHVLGLCVCVCVCVFVCFPYSGSTHNEKCNERYRRVKRQICGNIKKTFFLKLSYSKVRAFFTHLGRGGHL